MKALKNAGTFPLAKSSTAAVRSRRRPRDRPRERRNNLLVKDPDGAPPKLFATETCRRRLESPSAALGGAPVAQLIQNGSPLGGFGLAKIGHSR